MSRAAFGNAAMIALLLLGAIGLGLWHSGDWWQAPPLSRRWTWAGLVVLAYAAAGLSLLLGTATRRPSGKDRLFGIGAIFACVLLLATYPLMTLLWGVVVVVVAWGLFRVFGGKGR